MILLMLEAQLRGFGIIGILGNEIIIYRYTLLVYVLTTYIVYLAVECNMAQTMMLLPKSENVKEAQEYATDRAGQSSGGSLVKLGRAVKSCSSIVSRNLFIVGRETAQETWLMNFCKYFS